MEIATHLKNSHLLQGLDDEDLAIAEEHMYETCLEPGEALFNDGDDGGYMCFVVSGSLEALKKNSAGEEVRLTLLGSGDSIGEMAVIDGEVRSATVRSVDEAKLLVLTRKGFGLLLEQHPRIGAAVLMRIARFLSKRVRESSNVLVEALQPAGR
ncbi:MAG: cyclic nucleotide-binding domain-containing protein [Cellvibrionaceae bacterium]